MIFDISIVHDKARREDILTSEPFSCSSRPGCYRISIVKFVSSLALILRHSDICSKHQTESVEMNLQMPIIALGSNHFTCLNHEETRIV